MIAANQPFLGIDESNAEINKMPKSPNRLRFLVLVVLILNLSIVILRAQAPGTSAQGPGAQVQESAGTSTDLFVMFGSDFDRPGLLPRANYNIGIGHTFGFLKKDPIGDELTFGYTYENAGT